MMFAIREQRTVISVLLVFKESVLKLSNSRPLIPSNSWELANHTNR